MKKVKEFVAIFAVRCVLGEKKIIYFSQRSQRRRNARGVKNCRLIICDVLVNFAVELGMNGKMGLSFCHCSAKDLF